jgi:D-alanyl-D-alanine carboxypeptidase
MLAPLAARADSLVPTVIADVETGEVLHAEQATRPWYPASTTKLMTAYTALRAVRDGSLKMDTPLVVSALAAGQRPSKIGVRPGQEVTLENALMLMLVKSANDIAVVVAEGVGGTVPNFAAMMNREARRIGMRESNFTNPHGWEDARQVTSARDLAMLARALLLEFPEYSDFWHLGAVKLGARTYANTNGLIGRYSGAIGMKTGFICASGFNLVGAARRDGRTLIAVVLGAATGADRTLKAAQLLDQGFGVGGGFFGRAGQGRTLASLTASVETSAPNRRADICRRGAPPASDSDDGGGAMTYGNPSGDNPSQMFFSGRAQGEAASVGQRIGNTIALGPRGPLNPVNVYLGRKPGSNAHGPGSRCAAGLARCPHEPRCGRPHRHGAQCPGTPQRESLACQPRTPEGANAVRNAKGEGQDREGKSGDRSAHARPSGGDATPGPAKNHPIRRAPRQGEASAQTA